MAQLVERMTSNHEVRGSNPRGSSCVELFALNRIVFGTQYHNYYRYPTDHKACKTQRSHCQMVQLPSPLPAQYIHKSQNRLLYSHLSHSYRPQRNTPDNSAVSAHVFVVRS